MFDYLRWRPNCCKFESMVVKVGKTFDIDNINLWADHLRFAEDQVCMLSNSESYRSVSQAFLAFDALNLLCSGLLIYKVGIIGQCLKPKFEKRGDF